MYSKPHNILGFHVTKSSLKKSIYFAQNVLLKADHQQNLMFLGFLCTEHTTQNQKPSSWSKANADGCYKVPYYNHNYSVFSNAISNKM